MAPTRSETLQPEYEHGIGEFTLDLTQVELREDTTVAVEQGIGQLRVVLPDDASVSIDANVGAGAVILFGDEEGGFDFTRTFENIVAGEPTLHLDLDMGAGAHRHHRELRGPIMYRHPFDAISFFFGLLFTAGALSAMLVDDPWPFDRGGVWAIMLIVGGLGLLIAAVRPGADRRPVTVADPPPVAGVAHRPVC